MVSNRAYLSRGGMMRAVTHLEEVDYTDRHGDSRKGNILSMHWHRFTGTTFRLLNDSDRIAIVHHSKITWMAGGPF